jgi:hypothetical protein
MVDFILFSLLISSTIMRDPRDSLSDPSKGRTLMFADTVSPLRSSSTSMNVSSSCSFLLSSSSSNTISSKRE